MTSSEFCRGTRLASFPGAGGENVFPLPLKRPGNEARYAVLASFPGAALPPNYFAEG